MGIYGGVSQLALNQHIVYNMKCQPPQYKPVSNRRHRIPLSGLHQVHHRQQHGRVAVPPAASLPAEQRPIQAADVFVPEQRRARRPATRRDLPVTRHRGLLHELLVHQTADTERAFAINPQRPAPTHELVMAFARQARASGLIQVCLYLTKGRGGYRLY